MFIKVMLIEVNLLFISALLTETLPPGEREAGSRDSRVEQNVTTPEDRNWEDSQGFSPASQE